MRERFQLQPLLVSRILIWAALSVSLLGYIRWGSELVSITTYYHIRRSVPYIWSRFYEGLPSIGSQTALDILYWACLAALIAGVLALLWLALAPNEETLPEPSSEGDTA